MHIAKFRIQQSVYQVCLNNECIYQNQTKHNVLNLYENYSWCSSMDTVSILVCLELQLSVIYVVIISIKTLAKQYLEKFKSILSVASEISNCIDCTLRKFCQILIHLL